MKIREELMRYLIDEAEYLRSGTVTIEISATSNKTDVVTKALVNDASRKRYRILSEQQVSWIRSQIQEVEFGRVTIQIDNESGSPEIFSERRKRFPHVPCPA
jgi:hypothetical protein